MKSYKYEVIMCIVNSGFSETVMDAARELGARGGTVIRGRGTANAEAEKLYGIAIQPEKEIVMILIDSALKNDILHAIYKTAGLKTPGQGIAFALPVEDVVGLSETSLTDFVKSSNN
jgi:nitrogen regulatory protein PII